MLGQIKLLYDIERLLREEQASPARRRQVRQEQAQPELEALKPWLEAHSGLPRSVWGKAVRYMQNRWEKLTRFLSDGRIEVNNNLVENAIRLLAVGHKNYLV